MSHSDAIKAASSRRNPPAELAGKFQYGTAGVSIREQASSGRRESADIAYSSA